jgi:hypothetical protein
MHNSIRIAISNRMGERGILFLNNYEFETEHAVEIFFKCASKRIYE